MSEHKPFEIDFSEAKAIGHLPERAYPITQNETARLENIWGFSAPKLNDKSSGLCALGTVLYFHSIGWNHLPREQNGRPVNNPYIEELTRWSNTPSMPAAEMGITPNALLASLRKAGLNAQWHAGNPVEETLKLIEHEIVLGQPVIVLINHRPQGQAMGLEWQVVFKMTGQSVHTKHSAYADAERVWSIEEFSQCFQMDLKALSCSVIRAEKE
jgi:hypothetical protein